MIYISGDSIGLISTFTAGTIKAITATATPIGVVSGMMTLLATGLEFYNGNAKEKAYREKRRNEISAELDYVNEGFKKETDNTKALYNTHLGKNALVNSAIEATLLEGKELNIDPLKLAYDIDDLIKTGEFSTYDEAFAFDANLRKIFYNSGRSTPQVDTMMVEIFKLMQNGEDLTNILDGYLLDFTDSDGKDGISVKDVDKYFIKQQDVINRDFKNLEFSDKDIAEIEFNREILKTVDEIYYYNKNQSPEEVLQYLSLEEGKQYGNFRPEIIYETPVIVERIVRHGIEEEVIHYYNDIEAFGKAYDAISEEVEQYPAPKNITHESITKNKKYWQMHSNENNVVVSSPKTVVNPRDIDGPNLTEHYGRGFVEESTVEDSSVDSGGFGMFDIFADIRGIGEITNSLVDVVLGVSGLAPMTVQAETLTNSESSSVVSGDDGEEENKSTPIGPVKPDYFVTGNDSDIRDLDLLENLVDMFTEYLSRPKYKTINNTIGKDVDYDYIMKELQKEIDNAFSIMPNIVNRSYC